LAQRWAKPKFEIGQNWGEKAIQAFEVILR
jgi:hypothetical protein